MAGLTEQLIFGGGDLNYPATYYYNPFGYGIKDATESNSYAVVSTAGDIKNLYIEVNAAPGTGKSHAFTLMKNGVATSLTITISEASTSGSNVADTIAVVAGDLLSIRMTPTSTPPGLRATWNLSFAPTISGETLLMSKVNSSTKDYYHAIVGKLDASATEAPTEIVIPCNGDLKKLFVKVGTGIASRTFTVRINEVDTTLTATVTGTSSTTGSDVAHTVAVSAGDRVSIVRTGDAGTSTSSFGLCFVPSTAGNFIIPLLPTAVSTSATRYNFISGNIAWDASEGLRDETTQACSITRMYVDLSTAPDNGAGTQSYAFTLRKNAADTALTLTISEATKTGNASSTVAIAVNDLLATKCIPSGTPLATNAKISYLGYLAPTAETKEITINANTTFKQTEIQETISSDVKFVIQEVANVPSDVTFKKTGIEKNILSDIHFKKEWAQQAIYSNVQFAASKQVGINSDATFKRIEQKTTQSDVSFKKTSQNSITSDVYFKDINQKTIVSDVKFISRKDSSMVSDVHFLTYKDFYAKLKARAIGQKDFYVQLVVGQAAPVNVTGLHSVDLKSGDSIELLWDSDLNYGYNVYKEVGGSYVKLNSTPILTNSYIVGALTTGLTYTFKVVGVNGTGAESSGVTTTGLPTFDIERYRGTSYRIELDGVPLVGYCLDSIEKVFGPQFSTARFHIQTRPDVLGLPVPSRQITTVYINDRLVFTGYLVRRENNWTAKEINVSYMAIDLSWKYTWRTPASTAWIDTYIAANGHTEYYVGGSRWVWNEPGENNRILRQLGAPSGLPGQDTIDNQNIADNTILEVMSSYASSCGNWVLYTDPTGVTSYYQHECPQNTRTYTIGKNILSWKDTDDITNQIDKVITVGTPIKTKVTQGLGLGPILIASAEGDDIHHPSAATNPMGIDTLASEGFWSNFNSGSNTPAWLRGPDGWKRMGIDGMPRYLLDPYTEKPFIAFLLFGLDITDVVVEAETNARPEVITPHTIDGVQVEVSPYHLERTTWATGTTESRSSANTIKVYSPAWSTLSATVIPKGSYTTLIRIDNIPVRFKDRVYKSKKNYITVEDSVGTQLARSINVMIMEEPWQYIAQMRVSFTRTVNPHPYASFGSGDVVRTQTITQASESLLEKSKEALSRAQHSTRQGQLTILGDETLELRTQVNGMEVIRITHDLANGFITSIDLTTPQNIYVSTLNKNIEQAVLQRRLTYSEISSSNLISRIGTYPQIDGVSQDKKKDIRTSEASWGD